MQIQKIIVPILLAMVVCAGGYWLVTQKAPESVKSDTTQGDLFSQQAGSQVSNNQGNPDQAVTNQPITKPVDNQKIMNATLHTNKGDITIEFNQETPNTVANFVKLAQSGFYDGTKFHRVIKGFMNQGGDPLSKDDSKKDYWGTGGPGYQFADEITPTNHNDIGTISMANAGPNTNGSQFFINAAPNNFLDQKHTVFGKVTSGMDVVTAINNVATSVGDRPVDPVVLQSITLK